MRMIAALLLAVPSTFFPAPPELPCDGCQPAPIQMGTSGAGSFSQCGVQFSFTLDIIADAGLCLGQWPHCEEEAPCSGQLIVTWDLPPGAWVTLISTLVGTQQLTTIGGKGAFASGRIALSCGAGQGLGGALRVGVPAGPCGEEAMTFAVTERGLRCSPCPEPVE